MNTIIRVYRQNRPEAYFVMNPHHRWRCDIFPPDGSDHHGIGETEAEAILMAGLAYSKHEKAKPDLTLSPEASKFFVDVAGLKPTIPPLTQEQIKAYVERSQGKDVSE